VGHGVATEDNLWVLQDDVLEGVAKRVRLAFEDKGAAVLLGPAVAGKHNLTIYLNLSVKLKFIILLCGLCESCRKD
jgi:hypothetical protein